MQKYDFSIRTRDGQLIKRLMIAGKDQEDAERKLMQMYHHCEIVQKKMIKPGQKSIGQDFASLLAEPESISP